MKIGRIKRRRGIAHGEIKPVFPLFDRDLQFSGDGSISLPMRPPVKKVFVETTEEDINGGGMTSSSAGDDEIVGPYCEWSSRKAVEAAPAEVCKKSNSTGFSRIWRFKEFVGRCNSDGRDAFVFLNNAPPRAAAPAVEKSEKAESTTTVKVNRKGKKSGKTAPLSAHEAYMRSKAKEEERRRSYLPYRPELMGFFTNVNGGLTKNVHPF
ncbi:hypothetical protein DH2020_049743 [Rehmannia glutinosa]|uniref:Uncharacterized protein n=1 Tax=Rehmannia glutinosa TaxID=99300 RepID=A0ABR0U2R2_REHGL